MTDAADGATGKLDDEFQVVPIVGRTFAELLDPAFAGIFRAARVVIAPPADIVWHGHDVGADGVFVGHRRRTDASGGHLIEPP